MGAPITPFSKVFDEIWRLLEADIDFSNTFALGNRIKFNEDSRDPIKQNIASEDTPEIMLTTGGAAVNLGNTSSSTRIAQTYSIIVNTGDMRINQYIHAINWLLLCKLDSWNTTLSALLWVGQPFVKTVRVTSGTTGQSNQERNRGISGWGAVWNVEVEMYFSKSTQMIFSEP